MLPETHYLRFACWFFFSAYYFVIRNTIQLYRANNPSRATIGTQAKRQIRLQVLSKIVSMIRKYHYHKPKSYPWHHEEEPCNHHETPGRQTKQSNQLSLPSQDDCKTRMDIKPGLKAPVAIWYQTRLLPGWHFKFSSDHPFIHRSAIYWPLFCYTW